ncbi:MAG: transcriptional regulator [Deltaproteobacteria bacterium]|nr:MAG: transcriptional regulator [Deltaproteobacteria bacterium]
MDRCTVKCIHEEKVRETTEALPGNDTVAGMAEIFKALSDPGRLRIVLTLLFREHCVCDIAAICGQRESAISHQLRLLRAQKIVKNRREGKTVYYSLDDAHVESLIRMSLDHATHD